MATHILQERGYFWWHDDPIPKGQFAPQDCLTGVLTVDDTGAARLELDGYFAKSEGGPMAALLSSDRPIPLEKGIQGKLKECGRSVLLLGLRRSGGRFSTVGISYEGFVAGHCLVGTKAIPPRIKFSSLKIELTGFEEWLRLGNIEISRTKSRLTTKHRLPRADIYDLEGGSLKVDYDITGPWPYKPSSRVNNMTFTESVSIEFKPDIALPLAEMRSEYSRMQDLFILLTGSDYCLPWPSLRLGKSHFNYYFESGNRSSVKPPTRDQCWTNYIQLKTEFGNIVSNWKRKRDEFGPGFYLYLGVRRGMKLYVEHKFVNLIWGLESLHRKKYVSTPVETKLDAKIKRILSQISEKKDRLWLERKLANSAEPSLQDRLYDVLSTLPLGLEEKALREFTKACADRRNDISHFGGQRHDRSYNDFLIEIVKKTEALSYLYHALLLVEIGVDSDVIREHIFSGISSMRAKSVLNEAGLRWTNE